MLRPTIRSLNHLLLLALLCALFEITPIQAKPSGQAPAASPQLLIPTWGAAPGGVWHYTASTNWVLKNSGLPSGKYWFWIAADPFNDQRWLMLGNSTSNGYGSQFFRIASGAVVMNDGVTAPLWVTENAGLTWNSLSLPGVGSLTTGIDMRRVEWSETVNGQWMVGWGIDSTARNGYEVLNRGSLGGAITTAVLFGPQRGTGFMSAFPGGNGEIVVHDRRGNGIDVSRIGYVLPGANAVAGNTSGPSITFWNNLERLPIPGASRALVGAASGADSGLWATSNYSSSALTKRLTTSSPYTAPTRDGAVYMAGNVGIQRVDNLLLSPVVTTVAGKGSSTGFIRVDRKNRATVAAIATGNTGVHLLANSCNTWELVTIPSTMRAVGLANRLEVISGDVPLDTDCDALLDGWEINGYRHTDSAGNIRIVDLPAMGADPYHKDVFLELDYMGPTTECVFLGFGCVTYDPKPKAWPIERITKSFAEAPLSNPDNTRGITLHTDVGSLSVMNPKTGVTWGDLSRADQLAFDPVTTTKCASGVTDTLSDAIRIYQTKFVEERRPIFHYAVFAHEYSEQEGQCIFQNPTGSSGATLPAGSGDNSFSMILVTLGSFDDNVGSDLQQAGTLMHELGHDLGLDHGGPTALSTPADPNQTRYNFKPNYLGIMNYAYQMGDLLVNRGAGNEIVIDYARDEAITLNEASLSEPAGLGAFGNYRLPQFWCTTFPVPQVSSLPVDWNCNGTTTDTNVSRDVNRRGYKDPTNGIQTLKSFVDWPHLNFAQGAIGNAGVSIDPTQVQLQVPTEKYTKPDYDAITRPYAVSIEGTGVLRVPTGTGWNDSYTLTVKNTGTIADTYLITPTSTLGWATFPSIPNSITLSPGQQAILSLTVAVPTTALEGAEDEIEVEVQSSGVRNLHNSGRLRIQIDSLFQTSGASYTTGSLPAGVVEGDFNGDAQLDVAVANANDNNVSVLLGNGTGKFAPAVQYSVGNRPIGITTGNINTDTHLDIIVANYNSDSISVLLGNGNGTFAPAVQTVIGANPWGNGAPYTVTTGYLNGDTYLDLVVGNINTEMVSVLLGTGTGGFATPVHYTAGYRPFSVAIDDFNGDTYNDLVVAISDSDTVGVLLGSGTGTFATAIPYTVGYRPSGVTTGDFNGDLIPDLAVTRSASEPDDHAVSVLLGTGTGSFDPPTHYSTGRFPQSVTAGDVNADSFLDLIVVNSGDANISVLFGTGTGTFVATAQYPTGDGAISVALGDVNRDGTLDLAVASSTASSTQGSVKVLFNMGAGTFAAAAQYPAGSYPTVVATGHFNNDPYPDLAVSNFDSFYATGSVSVLLATDADSFAAPVQYAVSESPFAITADDFNNDGYDDLAVTTGLYVDTLLATSTGTFNSAVSYSAGWGESGVITGHFNNDSWIDLVVLNTYDNTASILLGSSTGSFAPAVQYPVGASPRSAAVGDLNGDTHLDLAVANVSDHTVSVLLGSGTGSFAPAVQYPVGNNFPQSAVLKDFNGDTHLDLAVATTSGTVSILLGTGTGTFNAAVQYAVVGIAPMSVASDDFNGDTHADLAVVTRYSVDILLGTGTGVFVAAGQYQAGKSPTSVIASDFNDDQKIDLVLVNQGSNSITVLLNTFLAT